MENFSPSLKDSIETIAKNEGYVTYDISVKAIPTEGGSYLGDLFAVDIKGQKADEGKVTNLFVKRLNLEAAENMKELITDTVSAIYTTESFIYNDLSKLWNELQDEVNIPEEERYRIVRGYAQSSDEALILENVAKQGYKTSFRLNLMSYEFTKLSIEQLAKFHSLSFVIEKRRPEYYKEKIQTRKSLIKWNGDGWKKISEGIMKSTVKNVYDEEIRKKAEDFIPYALETYPKYFNLDRAPVRVLCHGDYRMNNILMKEIEGRVTDVIPVDYQIIYYGCPINDFLYFIYFGTDKKLRDEHLEDLKDHYLDTMERFLLHFDIAREDVFPRKLFDQMFEERRDMGLMVYLMYLAFSLVEEQDVIDISKQKLDEWKPVMHESFQKRFGDVVEEILK